MSHIEYARMAQHNHDCQYSPEEQDQRHHSWGPQSLPYVDRPQYGQTPSHDSTKESMPSPPPLQFKKSKLPSRVALMSMVLCLVLAAALIIPLVALFVYIFIWHGATVEGLTIMTAARPVRILAIIQVVSKVAEQTIVPTMSIMASLAAAKWWKSSRNQNFQQNPTGLQLGVAMSVLGGANLRSVQHGFTLLLGLKSGSQHRGLVLPTYIRSSIFLLCWMLTLHFAISGVDMATHWSIKETMVIEEARFGNNTDPSTLLYSRPFNLTRCEAYREANNIISGANDDNCDLDDGNNSAYIALPDALRTLSNSSATNMVAWANDGTAIAVPASTANISYTSQAVGVKTTCQSITNRCMTCSLSEYTNPDGSPSYTCKGSEFSPEAYFNFACPNLNTTSPYTSTSSTGYVDGIIDPTTNSQVVYPNTTEFNFFSTLAPSNPFRYAFVAETFAYANLGNATSGGLIADTGFLEWGHLGGLSVIDCSVNVVEVDYQFTPPSTYVIKSSTSAPLNQTQYMSYNMAQGSVITTAVQGAGAVDGSMSFSDAAALQLSRQMVARSAILYDTQPVVEVNGIPSDGASVSIIPLALLVVFAGLLALTILLVGICSAAATLSAGSPAQSVVKGRLLDPFAVLADTYGTRSRNGDNLLSTDGFRYFSPQQDSDRLDISEVWDGTAWSIHPTRIQS